MSKKRAELLWALMAGPTHGLEIQRAVGRHNVYPALRSMEWDGLLKSWEGVGVRSGRTRRYYQLTEAGRKVARDPFSPR